MNLKSYVPHKRDQMPEVVSISKSRQLIFYQLMAEKLKLKEGQHAELLFDTDELDAKGTVSKIFLRIYDEKPNHGQPTMALGAGSGQSITVNVQGLTKQIKYPHEIQKYYKAYPYEHGGVEYIAIDLSNPLVELEATDNV